MVLKSSHSEGEGEWICRTDLLQMGVVKKRPILLPHDSKRFVFIESKSKMNRFTVNNTQAYMYGKILYNTTNEEPKD